MARIDVFEDFLETMNEHALSENQVDVNSMYVVDNEHPVSYTHLDVYKRQVCALWPDRTL